MMHDYTTEQYDALTSIYNVWRASFNTSDYFNSATARFKACRDLVSRSPSYRGSRVASEISPSMFFDFKGKSTPYRKTRPSVGGDFDDMGNGHIERQYRYDQNKRRGRF